MGKKLEDVRVVTFSEDYKPQGVVIYAAKDGEGKDAQPVKHYIHKSVVQILKDSGVKLESKEFEEKKEVSKAKEAFDKAKKEDK